MTDRLHVGSYMIVCSHKFIYIDRPAERSSKVIGILVAITIAFLPVCNVKQSYDRKIFLIILLANNTQCVLNLSNRHALYNNVLIYILRAFELSPYIK